MQSKKKINDPIRSLHRMEAHTKMFYGFVLFSKVSGCTKSLNELVQDYCTALDLDFDGQTLINAYYSIHKILIDDRNI